METSAITNKSLQWNISVPIFRNTVILRQLAWSIGVPFGIVIGFIALFSEGRERLYALGLIAALFLLIFVFILGFYGGKVDAAFTMDAKGVHYAVQPGQAKKNTFINGMAVVLGLISGKPAVAGAGMLANTRQSVRIPWKHIRRVKTYPRHHTILLRGAPTEVIAVFCTDENYAEVLAVIQAHCR